MTATDTATVTKTQYAEPGLWTVVIKNDDYTPMDFVTQLLMHVFFKSQDEAEEIMLTIHVDGEARVGIYTKEVAVMKARQCVELAAGNSHPLLADPQPMSAA